MLNQPAIFLGGQGGMVGPLRLGYGNMTVAGTVLRKDILEDHKLIIGKTYGATVSDYKPHSYYQLPRILKNNLIYLANLAALESWYRHVRRSFFSTMEYGDHLYRGVLDKLTLARKERTSRLIALAEKVPRTHEKCGCGADSEKRDCELHNNIHSACGLFDVKVQDGKEAELRDRFLGAFEECCREGDGGYIQQIKAMPPGVSQHGVMWLQQIVDSLCHRAGAFLPSFGLF